MNDAAPATEHLGAGAATFATTHWSVVLAVGEEDTTQARAALELYRRRQAAIRSGEPPVPSRPTAILPSVPGKPVNDGPRKKAGTQRMLVASLKHEKRVTSAHFSPDGSRVLTACDDGTAWVWDVPPGHSPGKSLERNQPQNQPQGEMIWLYLSILLLVLSLPAVGQIQFTYATNNGTIAITKYTGPGGDVAIPRTITGLPVTSIQGEAFEGRSSLTNITIGDNVISIGHRAFSSCTSLTRVTIPDSVRSIGAGAFEYCLNLASVTIPAGLNHMGDTAFAGWNSLTNVTIPASVTNMGYGVFADCPRLAGISVDRHNAFYSSVDGILFDKNRAILLQCPGGKTGSYTIPDSVTRIGRSAFSGCASLTNVTIRDSVTHIGDSAFSDCMSLAGIMIGNGVTRIENRTFHWCCSLTHVAIPNRVTTIGDRAFEYCTNLTSITIPPGITHMGYAAFRFCIGLKSVTIPASLTHMGELAFYRCTNLTNVSIPPGVAIIGPSAFIAATSLTAVTIPASVTRIGDGAFDYCTRLTTISVDQHNPFYSSVDGVLFNESQTTLLRCPGGKTGSYTVPVRVTRIGPEAFFGCISLTSVTIPDSVTRIETAAFDYCTNLKRVFFEGNAPTTGSGVFSDTKEATIYYLPGTTGWGTTFSGRPTKLWQP